MTTVIQDINTLRESIGPKRVKSPLIEVEQFDLNQLDKISTRKMSKIVTLLSSVVFKMVHLIIQLSPLAACALTAWIVGTQGMAVLEKLLKLVGCAYLAFGVQYLVFGFIIFVWTKLSPLPFFKKSLEYQTLAFSTSSTKAALPTTIKVCQNRL